MSTLRERVALATALLFTPNRQPDMSGNPMAKLTPSQRRDCFDAADAAIEIVLEEAAKVAETCFSASHPGFNEKCAAAIRDLKEE